MRYRVQFDDGSSNVVDADQVTAASSAMPPTVSAPAAIMTPPSPAAVDPRMTVPEEVAEAAMQAGGPDAVDELRDLVLRNPSPEAAAADLDVQLARLENEVDVANAVERIDEALEDVENLRAGAFDAAAYKEQVKAAFREFRQIEREYWQAQTARTRATWRSVSGLRWEEANVIWERYWSQTLEHLDSFLAALDHADETLGAAIGMTPEAIARAKAYRAFRARHKAEYAEELRKTWARSRGESDAAARSAIWEDFHSWADRHYAAKEAADDTYLEARVTDTDEAIAHTIASGRLPDPVTPVTDSTPASSTPPTNGTGAAPDATSATSATSATASQQAMLLLCNCNTAMFSFSTVPSPISFTACHLGGWYVCITCC
jgi:hypothetical protein